MIEQARLRAAERYPESLTDSKGRVHRCIPREALLRGDWDSKLNEIPAIERGGHG